jgi:hypothetical protein
VNEIDVLFILVLLLSVIVLLTNIRIGFVRERLSKIEATNKEKLHE